MPRRLPFKMKLKLVEKKLEAKDSYTFVWKPEKKINYLPGQYFYYTLPKMQVFDPRGATRHFTISSSPTEGDNISFTTRIRDKSAYKQAVKELNVGDYIEGEGPNGTYIIDENEPGPHVFLAGGIGITPFRSAIKYNVDKKLEEIKIHLIYANSNSEDIVFKKELEKFSKDFKNIKVDFTVSRPEESQQKWEGITGRIDEALIRKLITDTQKPTFWVCGPPAMVETLEQILGKLKITSDRVRSEKFTGY